VCGVSGDLTSGVGEEERRDMALTERLHTIVCTFDQKSPRISTYQIHEWIHEQLRLQETDIRLIQIDGPRRKVYIKFINNERMMVVLQSITELAYEHMNGERSLVNVEVAGMGMRRIRVANLPPEVPDRVLRDVLSSYGEVKKTTDEP
jgi:hypothetical protein